MQKILCLSLLGCFNATEPAQQLASTSPATQRTSPSAVADRATTLRRRLVATSPSSQGIIAAPVPPSTGKSTIISFPGDPSSPQSASVASPTGATPSSTRSTSPTTAPTVAQEIPDEGFVLVNASQATSSSSPQQAANLQDVALHAAAYLTRAAAYVNPLRWWRS